MFWIIVISLASLAVLVMVAVKVAKKKRSFYGDYYLGEITKNDIPKEFKKYERQRNKQNLKRKAEANGFKS